MSRVRIKDASKLIVTLPSIGKPRLGSTLPRRAGDSSQSPTQWQPKFNLQAISSSLRYKKPSLPGFAKTMAASLGQQKPSSPNPQTLPESEWDFNRQQNDRGGFSINPADINPLAKVAESPEDLMLAKDYVRHGSAEFQGRPTSALSSDLVAKQHKAQILVDNFAFPLGPNQLYTPYDLSMDAWRQRQKVKYAAFAETQDPFDRIGVDPYWEYKVLSSSQLDVDVDPFRIINYCRVLCHQWDEYYQ